MACGTHLVWQPLKGNAIRLDLCEQALERQSQSRINGQQLAPECILDAQ
jgi:hypothetical protein